jgi:hypothetical protein
MATLPLSSNSQGIDCKSRIQESVAKKLLKKCIILYIDKFKCIYQLTFNRQHDDLPNTSEDI